MVQPARRDATLQPGHRGNESGILLRAAEVSVIHQKWLDALEVVGRVRGSLGACSLLVGETGGEWLAS